MPFTFWVVNALWAVEPVSSVHLPLEEGQHTHEPRQLPGTWSGARVTRQAIREQPLAVVGHSMPQQWFKQREPG